MSLPSAYHAFLVLIFLVASPACAWMKIGYGRVRPITFKDKDGHAAGFAVDVLNEAARREGIALEWVTTQSSAAAERMLERGDIDLLSAGMVTPERQRQFFVSRPWWSEDLTLVTRADLAGPIRRLALTPIYVSMAKKAYPGAVLTSGQWLEDDISAVCSGKADAALITHGELHDVFMNRPQACLTTPLNSGDLSAAIELAVISRHADEQKAQTLRKRIDEMAIDGTLIRLASEHPPIATNGAIRLAEQVRERSRARLWMILILLLAPIAVWRAFSERRRTQSSLNGQSVAAVIPDRSTRLLFAFVVSLIAVGARYLLVPILGFRAPFLLQSFAIAAAAQYGGIGSGLATTAICIVLGGFVFAEPLAFGIFPKEPSDATALAIFLLLAVSLSYFGERFIAAKRRQLEAERSQDVERQHKAELEAVFESMAEPLLIVDDAAKVVVSNSAFRSSYENVEIDLLDAHGQPVPPEMRPAKRALRGETVRDLELTAIHKNGQSKIVNYNASPVYSPGGKIVRAVVTSTDISVRKLAEQQIRTLNTELEERVANRTAQLEVANQELEAFSYSVSHDLRAPLRGIDGWSLALEEDCAAQLDERGLSYLERVRAEAQRMGLLIDDLLALSRIARSELRCDAVDLSAIARGVADRLMEANPVRQLDFVIAPGLTTKGDARLLEIALTNLLGNAVKFTGTRDLARIEVGKTSQNGSSAFFVRDNGVGFDMAYVARLFGAFQRLHPASQFPGTGIGLATVQRIVHRHGGKVWAEARKDEGAVFYFVLGNDK
jgi:signal transduction histidine kinase/ABC-type amino acid transport substrate-binding protein